MYGLIMLREYLDEILDGTKIFDVRAYNTDKRGTIALVDSKKSAIIGLIDLTGTHKITAEEYCRWHATGKWRDMPFAVEDETKEYYAYDFENPRRLSRPVKVTKTGKVWTRIEDDLPFEIQETLF